MGLSGDLGSGKTTFAKGFCAFFGITEIVTSPTFAIMKNYKATGADSKIKEIIHIDSYRIEEIESIGLQEYFKKEDTVILIEWPEKIARFLPKISKNLKFRYIDETTRTITETS